jgi:hypothetical protein
MDGIFAHIIIISLFILSLKAEFTRIRLTFDYAKRGKFPTLKGNS